MSLVRELATKSCERLTSREGCLGSEPEDEWCVPCRARAELGLPKEAPRFCENCHKTLYGVHKEDAMYVGIDGDGLAHCPAPLHVPHLFYDEFTKVGSR